MFLNINLVFQQMCCHWNRTFILEINCHGEYCVLVVPKPKYLTEEILELPHVSDMNRLLCPVNKTSNVLDLRPTSEPRLRRNNFLSLRFPFPESPVSVHQS